MKLMAAGATLLLCAAGVDSNMAGGSEAAAFSAEQAVADDEKEMRDNFVQGFARWDLDGDGKLSKAELGAHLKALHRARERTHVKRNMLRGFSAHDKLVGTLGADTDGDKQLSLAELLKARAAMVGRGTPDEQDAFRCLFPWKPADEAHEATHQAKLSFNFGFADRNGDGTLARAEFPAFHEPRMPNTMARWRKARAAATLAQHDRDSDGVVTFEEWLRDPGNAAGDRAHEESVWKASIDKDGDGKATLLEFEHMGSGNPDATAEMEAEHFYVTADNSPQDGMLSYEELKASLGQIGYGLYHKEEL